jgi:molecular chaperone GrpE (heat shock protein)
MTLKELAAEVKVIKENHLAHMQQDIDNIEKRLEKMDNRVWAILILLVVAVVLPAVVNFITTYTP